MRVPLRSESEKVVGEDENHIPVIDCPEVKPMPESAPGREKMIGRQWYDCPECGKYCLHEVNGKEYYHLITCSKNNGIDYEKCRPPADFVRPFGKRARPE